MIIDLHNDVKDRRQRMKEDIPCAKRLLKQFYM